MFCILFGLGYGRCSKEDVLRGGSVRGTSVQTGGGDCLYNGTVIDRCRSVSTCGTDGNWKAVGDTDIW